MFIVWVKVKTLSKNYIQQNPLASYSTQAMTPFSCAIEIQFDFKMFYENFNQCTYHKQLRKTNKRAKAINKPTNLSGHAQFKYR